MMNKVQVFYSFIYCVSFAVHLYSKFRFILYAYSTARVSGNDTPNAVGSLAFMPKLKFPLFIYFCKYLCSAQYTQKTRNTIPRSAFVPQDFCSTTLRSVMLRYIVLSSTLHVLVLIFAVLLFYVLLFCCSFVLFQFLILFSSSKALAAGPFPYTCSHYRHRLGFSGPLEFWPFSPAPAWSVSWKNVSITLQFTRRWRKNCVPGSSADLFGLATLGVEKSERIRCAFVLYSAEWIEFSTLSTACEVLQLIRYDNWVQVIPSVKNVKCVILYMFTSFLQQVCKHSFQKNIHSLISSITSLNERYKASFKSKSRTLSPFSTRSMHN